ncbi:MAG: bifunctional phosphoribosyl-AMP cyclohydrolase/phosphoribosyl-ATP diphosphatase HisIE [Nitrospirales bacterium]|nr:bifunctional phosphoribosyl-AMP cyclohydrolase/phosphoribosyl-ATP diphosphatase HisIE [Nitrospira sp.]MDR4500280.1 bifunctional phosphoribosyl-AMP cyclohydrolase/phosphoribosyl-ATP diphosphatase HisIE [Nitrospirales bacterium]
MNHTSLVQHVRFSENGLLPVVVQDWLDGTVLMVGFMNQEALQATRETKRVHFWSRSRQTLWKKGETSGHELLVKNLFIDCDRDTVLVVAEPIGPTCHTGNRTCFFAEVSLDEQDEAIHEPVNQAWGGILERLYQMVAERKLNPQEGSYVSRLLQGGTDRILKKVIEESGEVALAVKNQDRSEIIYEVADLWFHTIVALGHVDVPPGDVFQELGKRFGKSGLRTERGNSS